MKIIHISDLHIGKSLNGYSLIEDQRHVLRQVIGHAADIMPEALIIAGDVYDKSVPSAEAVEVFDEFLSALSLSCPDTEIMIIAGNHDSGERLDFASSILEKHRVHISGLPPANESEHMKKVELFDSFGKACFYLLPYTRPANIRSFSGWHEKISYEETVKLLIDRENIDTSIRNIIITHQFYAGSSPTLTCDSELLKVGGSDMISVSVLERFDYAALGHIHRAQNLSEGRIRYSGTLLKYSLSEISHKKSISLVELAAKGDEVRISELHTEPLHELVELKGGLTDIISAASGISEKSYVYITLTDEEETASPKYILEKYFENILEIKIDNSRTRKMISEYKSGEFTGNIPKPYDMWCEFFESVHSRKMSGREESILKDLWNRAEGGIDI